jgi:uncharacterized protein YkwD
MRFLFTGIALSSVVLTIGFLKFPANALDLSSLFDLLQEVELPSGSTIFPTNTEQSTKQAVPDQENSEQSTDIEQSTDSVDSIEQAVPSQENSEQPRDSLVSIEQAVHDQVNQYRASRGIPPLSLDSRISEQARNHSQSMASGAVPFSHDGFLVRVQMIARVMPYNKAAENVAYNQGYGDPVTQAVQGWLNSSGHRTNIQDQYNLTGIGIAKNSQGAYYFTQIFIRD